MQPPLPLLISKIFRGWSIPSRCPVSLSYLYSWPLYTSVYTRMRLSQELSSIQIRNIGDQPGTRKFMAEVILVLSTCQCQCPLSSKCLFVSFCALPWLERCDYYLLSLRSTAPSLALLTSAFFPPMYHYSLSDDPLFYIQLISRQLPALYVSSNLFNFFIEESWNNSFFILIGLTRSFIKLTGRYVLMLCLT